MALGWEPEDAPIEVQIEAWLNEVRPEGRRKSPIEEMTEFFTTDAYREIAEGDEIMQELRRAWGL